VAAVGGGSGQVVYFRGGFFRSSGRSLGQKYRMCHGTPWAARSQLQVYTNPTLKSCKLNTNCH
jgi:hypothetical protein